MPNATSQQINKFYDTFRTIDVTFTKEMVKSTGLLPQNVFLKCLGEQWPCVLYSSSFLGAKMLAGTKQAFMERLKKANNMISLRLCFKLAYKTDPVTFFISGRVTGMAPYAQSNGTLQFMNFQFTQRPPDDFVEIVGNVLEANVNSARRRDERIPLTPDSMRKMNILRKETSLLVQGVPRKCIIRDLSFGGAKLLIMGLGKFLVGKTCVMRLDLDEPAEAVEIPGKIVRSEDVEGRKDLAALAVCFDEGTVPMSYKIHINLYVSQQKALKTGEQAPMENSAAAQAGAVKPPEVAGGPYGMDSPITEAKG